MSALLLSSLLAQAQLEKVAIYRSAEPRALLVLVPGFNESGEGMLTESWKRFADREHLILLAPTFHAEPEEVHERRGYYYPELGSGEELEAEIAEIEKTDFEKSRSNSENSAIRIPQSAFDKVYLFGFSAGAHFVHRFALWKPERVAAFVAYSAGWWDNPTAKLKGIPALIMCGEADPRYDATKDFFKKGRELGCPWLWRSYMGIGHEVPPQAERMAQAFLAHYIEEDRKHTDAEKFIGDLQTYHVYPMTDLEKVPADLRLILPSKPIADEWTRER